jgi:hypothetical protein
MSCNLQAVLMQAGLFDMTLFKAQVRVRLTPIVYIAIKPKKDNLEVASPM